MKDSYEFTYTDELQVENTINIKVEDMPRIVDYYHVYNIREYIDMFDFYKNGKKLSDKDMDSLASDIYHNYDLVNEKGYCDYIDLKDFCNRNDYEVKEKNIKKSESIKNKNKKELDNDHIYTCNYISKKMEKALSDNGFSINESLQNNDKELCLDIQKYTPLGEDWHEILVINLPKNKKVPDQELFYKISERNDSFDVDEEAEIWVNHRGERGTPSSIKELVKDAEWKQNDLKKLTKSMYIDLINLDRKENKTR